MAQAQVLAKIDPRGRKARDHHHRIAFLVATGKRTGEIASLTGMSIQRVSNLRSEEEFKKLVEVYREKAIQIEFDAYKQSMVVCANILLLAREELRDRLEECPELFSVKDLNEIQADAADRLGQGKIQRNESVSMNIDLADSLAEARRRELRLSVSPSRDTAAGSATQPADPVQINGHGKPVD